ncbi:MAG TPA: hypothetical protein DCY27_06715 [Desulfobacterales bacterium]|nr:hypothetical protein [Desulfobacterales bacterium]
MKNHPLARVEEVVAVAFEDKAGSLRDMLKPIVNTYTLRSFIDRNLNGFLQKSCDDFSVSAIVIGQLRFCRKTGLRFWMPNLSEFLIVKTDLSSSHSVFLNQDCHLKMNRLLIQNAVSNFFFYSGNGLGWNGFLKSISI